jgi:hypothetical protein
MNNEVSFSIKVFSVKTNKNKAKRQSGIISPINGDSRGKTIYM